MNTTNEALQQKSSFIEVGSLSTVDYPSALLAIEEQQQQDRGILDEPSITLLSNSYRSMSSTTGQQATVANGGGHSSSHQQTMQKKKQCSSLLSTCGDKTSACSTPSLSPIKNESLLHVESTDRKETKTPVFLAMPAISGQSPLSSLQHSSQKHLMRDSTDDSSLSSFERHELSAGNATLLTPHHHEDISELAASNSSQIMMVTCYN